MVRRPRPAFEEPLRAVCVDGEVVITGPEHLHAVFSVEAALRSAAILEKMAELARQCEPPEEPEI